MDFKVVAPFQLSYAQEKAVSSLTKGLENNDSFQTLKGVTGSGKTFTMAKTIERFQKPALILSPNKTLAAQLYREFKDFFPHNAVEYFVSYYDYYQPEAYVPTRDLYIEKDASINEEIDKLRHAATSSLLSRNDVIVVATVSAIYGLGSPIFYKQMSLQITVGLTFRDSFIYDLINMQYERNDNVLKRGNFRVRGDIIDIWPTYSDQVYRFFFDFDELVDIALLDKINNKILGKLTFYNLFPAKHFVVPNDLLNKAISQIKTELAKEEKNFTEKGKVLEAQRLKTKTENDLVMLEELGYCSGVENYSRYLTGRKPGERPFVLLDYFPKHYLSFLDESHVLLGQLKAMYHGDKSRKENLVEYGFRLPSAKDNRPLTYEEFNSLLSQTVFVSATPQKEEIDKSANVVEQIIRPTGLLDPLISVRPSLGQIDDLYKEIILRRDKNEAVLVTTLTKKMAEDLSTYLSQLGIKVEYLHSEINVFDRVKVITSLRKKEIQVIVGVNLLREGLDIPEVSLVTILDAEKIGFLRSTTALIQTIGRAARNANGMVIMYADDISPAMQEAISETNRRREIQMKYNEEHHISPQTIQKSVQNILEKEQKEETKDDIQGLLKTYNPLNEKDRKTLIKKLNQKMLSYAKDLDFENALLVRNELEALGVEQKKK